MDVHGGQGRRLDEISRFLRSRRARLAPAELGLNVSSRRRTPGLRREEVAVLAGVGTSWYTWIEQGRDIHVSESVAGAISRALRLSDAERTYLYRLLGISTTVSADFRADLGGSRLRHVVDEWMPSPALILDEFWNILDRNEAADEVFGLTARDTNLLASFFLNPEHRERYEDPATVARRAVAHFRSDIATALDDRRCAEVVDTLSDRSPEFAALWHDHEILDIRDRRKRMRHPRLGRLFFDAHWLQLSDNERIRMVLCVPLASTETRALLETAFGGLRRVGKLVA